MLILRQMIIEMAGKRGEFITHLVEGVIDKCLTN